MTPRLAAESQEAVDALLTRLAELIEATGDRPPRATAAQRARLLAIGQIFQATFAEGGSDAVIQLLGRVAVCVHETMAPLALLDEPVGARH